MSGAARSEPLFPEGAQPPAHRASKPGVPAHAFLSPQEQEIVAMVYERTAATAAELEQDLPSGMTSEEVRAALGQLVAKQVLRETRRRKGVRLYVQALRQTELQQQAATRFVEEHFDGSLANAARLLVLLVHKHQPDSLAALSRFMDSAFAPRG